MNVQLAKGERALVRLRRIELKTSTSDFFNSCLRYLNLPILSNESRHDCLLFFRKLLNNINNISDTLRLRLRSLFLIFHLFFIFFHSMFDPPEADKCSLAFGELNVRCSMFLFWLIHIDGNQKSMLSIRYCDLITKATVWFLS